MASCPNCGAEGTERWVDPGGHEVCQKCWTDYVSVPYSRLPKEKPFRYSQMRWKRLARRVKEERGQKCERCGTTLAELQAKFPNCNNHLQAAHIKAVKEHPELALDESNIQVLCQKCHEETDPWPRLRNDPSSPAQSQPPPIRANISSVRPLTTGNLAQSRGRRGLSRYKGVPQQTVNALCLICGDIHYHSDRKRCRRCGGLCYHRTDEDMGIATRRRYEKSAL